MGIEGGSLRDQLLARLDERVTVQRLDGDDLVGVLLDVGVEHVTVAVGGHRHDVPLSVIAHVRAALRPPDEAPLTVLARVRIARGSGPWRR
jgi:hypothetical protein